MNYDDMSDIDKIIFKLFSRNWHGDLSSSTIEAMRLQLRNNLQDQVNGYWSGSTAYYIMTKGGFLVDSKRKPIESSGMCEGKKLTALGQMFMDSMK